MPKISIIIPVYNAEKYIGKCLDGVLLQTFTDFECILVDDGSPDNCGKICDEYVRKDERVKVIHKKNAGASSARNSGLDIVQGEWICFIDSDDWVENNYLELMYNNAINNNCELSICGMQSIDENGNIAVKSKQFPTILFFDKNSAKKRALISNNYFKLNVCCKLIKRKHVHNTRFDTDIKFYEDALFWFEIIDKIDKVVYDSTVCYNYYSNSDSVTRQSGLTDAAQTAFIAIDKMISMEKNYKVKNKIITNKILFALLLCAQHIRRNDCISSEFNFLRNIFSQYKKIIISDFSMSFYKKIKIALLLLFPRLHCYLSKIWRNLPFRRKEKT